MYMYMSKTFALTLLKFSPRAVDENKRVCHIENSMILYANGNTTED